MRRDYYEKHKNNSNKKGISYVDTNKMLTELIRQSEYLWLREADSQVMQESLRNLDRAYQNMYAKQAGYPNFKKRTGKQSIKYPQRFKVTEKSIYAPKVGEIKAVIHRTPEGTQKK